MTPSQIAELARLDAAIAAAPDDAKLLEERAQLRVRTGGDFEKIVADLNRAHSGALGHNRQLWKGDSIVRECRTLWQNSQSAPADSTAARFYQARLALYFSRALEPISRPMAGKARFSCYRDMIRWLQDATKLDLEAALSEAAGASVAELELAALTRAIVRDDREAARLYRLVLQAKYQTRAERLALARHWAIAPDAKIESYKRLASWELASADAPRDPNWHLERARWLCARDYQVWGLAEFDAAIALAPMDATLHEKRARLNTQTDWWDLECGAAGDHARAIRLRVAAGEFDGAPENLAAQGEKMSEREPARCTRIYAFYSLAIEGNPNVGSWYAARARAVMPSIYQPHGFEEQSQVALADYLRALALAPDHKAARRAVVEIWEMLLPYDSAHERMESLLEAQQSLRDAGIQPQLAREIIAEVEAALAQ